MKAKNTIRFVKFLFFLLIFSTVCMLGFSQYNVPADYGTIQEAIEVAYGSGGGTVYVGDGTYYENLSIPDNVYVVSENQDPGLAIIDASGSGNIVVFDACLNGGIIGFTLQNGGNKGQFAAIKITGDQAPIVAKNIIMGTLNGIRIQGDAQPLILNNTIVNNLQTGLLAGGNSPATILNNIIAFNTDSGISMNGGAIDLLEYNCVYGSTVNYDNIDQGHYDISEDPLFAASDDFHLQDLSPCKSSAYTFDVEATDMGAYGGSINIEQDYLTELHQKSGDVVTELGLTISIPSTKKASAKTTVSRIDRATYGLNKKKSSAYDIITYIVHSDVSEGEVTLKFGAIGLDPSSIEVYKISITNEDYVLKGTSATLPINHTELNGMWMVKGGKSATNVEFHDISDISVFPNPSNGIVNINLNDELKGAQVAVKDLSGKTILNQAIDKKLFSMDLQQQKGIYIIEISNKNEVFTRKVLVH